MFTGIVEELGRIAIRRDVAGGVRLRVTAPVVVQDAEIGASYAVNGCCLTVVDLGDDWRETDVVPDTLARTSVGSLQVGDGVNLERPVRLADRLGGHLVQGHVDAIGTLTGREPLADGSARLEFSAPPAVLRYVVEKGSIAVDGISLTVAGVGPSGFGVAVIPHTLSVTTLGQKQIGEPVNLEVDVLAKYVERLLLPPPGDAPAGDR